MSFEVNTRRRARHEVGCVCMVCNQKRGRKAADVHSTDRSHNPGTEMVVCTVREEGSCHRKIHELAEDPAEVNRISRAAAQLGGLAMADMLLKRGVPEWQVRVRLQRRPF